MQESTDSEIVEKIVKYNTELSVVDSEYYAKKAKYHPLKSVYFV